MRISDWSSDVCSSDLFEPFAHKCLKHMAFDRQAQIRKRCDTRGIARNRHSGLARKNLAAAGFNAGHPATGIANKSADFAVLDDVDAAIRRAAREAPDDAVLPRAARPLLPKPPRSAERRAGKE